MKPEHGRTQMNLEWVDSRKVLMAVACAALAVSLVRAPVEPPAAASPEARTPAKASPKRVAFAPAGSHDLFAPDAVAVPVSEKTSPVSVPSEVAATPTGRFRVRGIFQLGGRVTALILDVSTKQELLRAVGEKLEGAEILEIGFRKVIVGWQGRRERLPTELSFEGPAAAGGTSGN